MTWQVLMMNGGLVLTAGESKWHCDIRDLMPLEIPWRFVEKETIANSAQKRVPVLVDGEQMIADSWEIARYLEVTYPNLNPLFGGAIALGETLFIMVSRLFYKAFIYVYTWQSFCHIFDFIF